MFRPALGQAALYPIDRHIVAVASDQPPPPDMRDGVIWLDLNRPESILIWLREINNFKEITK